MRLWMIAAAMAAIGLAGCGSSETHSTGPHLYPCSVPDCRCGCRESGPCTCPAPKEAPNPNPSMPGGPTPNGPSPN
jgi:hypothetical protein